MRTPRSVTGLLGILLFLTACSSPPPQKQDHLPAVITQDPPPLETPYLVVLGTAQDAGFPQAGCEKNCCRDAWGDQTRIPPTCLGLVDPENQQKWLFEASPELPSQLEMLNAELPSPNHQPNGVFLTHAHIGHYTGLMYFGREVQGATAIPVYSMPRMQEFLKSNGPWSQLVALENIALTDLKADAGTELSADLTVRPILVPHRDEFSETVGFRIVGPSRSVLFIPDIDKWDRWERSLAEELAKVDLALLDGTFFENGELPGRDMSEIPHPFVVETMQLLADLPATEKAKVHFIHFNHTNPLVRGKGPALEKVEAQGFKVAKMGDQFSL